MDLYVVYWIGTQLQTLWNIVWSEGSVVSILD